MEDIGYSIELRTSQLRGDVPVVYIIAFFTETTYIRVHPGHVYSTLHLRTCIFILHFPVDDTTYTYIDVVRRKCQSMWNNRVKSKHIKTKEHVELPQYVLRMIHVSSIIKLLLFVS